MPIDISVTIFQMFASILMSLSYFRINSNFLKSCDKTFMKNLNKIKINLLKNILESKNKSKIERLKLLYKIIISLLIIILSIYFILSDIFFNLIEYFNNMLFIFIPFFIYMISLLYFTKKVNDLIIPKANIVILKFYLCMFKLIYLLSKQSFMAGIGFLFLFYSFFLDLINKNNISNVIILNVIEIISLLLIVLGASTFSIIFHNYQKNLKLR